MKVPKELASIIKSTSNLPQEKNEGTLAAHMDAIESRKAQEAETFLRACAIRLDLVDAQQK